MRTPEVIFIVGVGRSGTSLLHSMLAAHSQLACLPETAFIRRFVATGALQFEFATTGREAVIGRLQNDALFCRTGLDATSLLESALHGGGPLDMAIYRQMLLAHAGEGLARIGDKDPRLIEFLPLLKHFFPDSHVIHILRDPRDVLLSKTKAAWSRGGHVWRHIFANRVQLRMGVEQGPKLFGVNYHEVVYENLIEAPREILSALCTGLGLEFDAAMLDFGDAASALVSDSEISWKKETLGPLLPQNKGKWLAGLRGKDIRLTDSCCRQALARGRYPLATGGQKPGLLDWPWIVAGSIVIKSMTLPYMLYRKIKLKKPCSQAS